MKKQIFVGFSILLAVLNISAQTDQNSGDKLREIVVGDPKKVSAPMANDALVLQTNEYIRAVVNQDSDGIYKFMNPEYIESLGGQEQAMELIKFEFETSKNEDLKILSVGLKSAAQNLKTAVSPQKIKVSVGVETEGKMAVFDGELTAVAKGTNWYFIHTHTILGSFGIKEFEISDEESTTEDDANETDGNISKGVLNGSAVSLPAPAYPKAATAVGASGTVNVKVVIDEKGDVISAEAVSGHPLLQASAVSAAKQAKFKPTRLSGQPVKVSGIIVYNFTH